MKKDKAEKKGRSEGSLKIFKSALVEDSAQGWSAASALRGSDFPLLFLPVFQGGRERRKYRQQRPFQRHRGEISLPIFGSQRLIEAALVFSKTFPLES